MHHQLRTTEEQAALVSVIIPCYKQADFLPGALESALAQTHCETEIIVVDDGSPDNVFEVVSRYPTVKCVQQQNQGLAAARNAGFRVSTGDYVLFLDADDRFMPDAAAAHLSCFAKHPEAGFVVGDIDNISLDGSYLGSPRFPLLEGSVYEDVLKVNHVANSIAVMWRRSVFEQLGGFRPSCSPAEDIELLLRAARLFQTAHHRATVAQYRRYPNTLSRKGELMLPAIRRIMRLQDEVVKGNPALLAARREGYAYWRDYFGKETVKDLFAHIIHGSPRGAAKCLSTLFRYIGGRLFIWPWKYRRKIGRMVDSWFRRLRKRGDSHDVFTT